MDILIIVVLINTHIHKFYIFVVFVVNDLISTATVTTTN